MKNIVFTDIDGVLFPFFKKEWSKNAINVYNNICNDFNLYAVITSSRRLNMSINEIKQMFIDHGITTKIIDVTKNISNIRGLEIKDWLSNNYINDYVILDDNTYNIEPHVKNVVKCLSYIGLTNEHYFEIEKIFKNR